MTQKTPLICFNWKMNPTNTTEAKELIEKLKAEAGLSEEQAKQAIATIKNFGVENFYKDTYLLWRLAKLIEIVDDPEIAKIFYRLVLKHHRGEDD